MKPPCLPFSSIPSRPGTYVLIMRLDRSPRLQVGKLGSLHSPVGWYTYVGSALGPGGLAARLARHRQREKGLHWHIDYLLAASDLTEIWWAVSPKRWECAWAEWLSQMPGATVPLPGFGASDCRCPAHLLRFAHRPSASGLAAQLEEPPSLCCTVLARLTTG